MDIHPQTYLEKAIEKQKKFQLSVAVTTLFMPSEQK